MNPPPIPPSLPPEPPLRAPALPKKKRSLVLPIVLVLGLGFLGFLGFRIVQFARYMKEHPTQREPGAEELSRAISAIVGKSKAGAGGQGNTEEARALAGQLSGTMKTLRDSLFTKSKTAPEMMIMTGGEFLVYCQLNDDSCAFLVHVPEMSKFTAEAQDSLGELAYTSAAKLLDSAGKKNIKALAVGMRGNLLYERIIVGKYTPDAKDPYAEAAVTAQTSVMGKELYPYFAPNNGEGVLSEEVTGDLAPKKGE